MPVLTALDPSPSLGQRSAIAPVLRVRRRGKEGERTFQLALGKWTIGSSPQCQVCLPTSDVRPLQCLLTLAEDGAVATRWAAGVRVNGSEFSKTPIFAGDRLTIGEWDVEFGDAEPPSEERASELETALADPPAGIVGDAPDGLAPSEAIVSAPPAAQAAPEGSHAFADRLVLQLWTANHHARRRAKTLINDIRAARFHVEAMTADLAAMATELDLARAAYDCHAGRDQRLQEELAELSHRWNETHLELQAAQAERDRLGELYRLEAERAAALEQTQWRPATPSLAQPESTAAWVATSEAASGVAAPIAASEPAEAAWAPFDGNQETASESLPSSTADPDQDGEVDPWGVSAQSGPGSVAVAPETLVDNAVDASSAWPTAESIREDAAAESPPAPPAEQPAAAPTAVELPEQPAPEYAATSFIDKYRHLLEEDAEPPAPALKPLPGRTVRPLIDDEFLSPAKAQTCARPADDSDEALEAYMASMMSRVRGSSPSYSSSQAPVVVAAPRTGGASPLSHLLGSAAQAPDAEGGAPSVSDSIDEPAFDIELLKQATRKPPLASDLAALREMANTSARTAIASHSQRRTRESAHSRIVIALTAMASSGYLMLAAPAIDNWQFWAGAGSGAVGIAAAVQVILLERGRVADG